jgi:hypothetical protein
MELAHACGHCRDLVLDESLGSAIQECHFEMFIFVFVSKMDAATRYPISSIFPSFLPLQAHAWTLSLNTLQPSALKSVSTQYDRLIITHYAISGGKQSRVII